MEAAFSFLHTLNPDCGEGDIEEAWAGKVFPLALTDDFQENWRAARCEHGLFEDRIGNRYHIMPKEHFKPECHVVIFTPRGRREIEVTYAALILSKVAFRLFLNTSDAFADASTTSRRDAFMANYISKFPQHLRDVIVARNLYLDHGSVTKIYPLSTLGIYMRLADTQNIRVLVLLPSERQHTDIQCLLLEQPLQISQYEALSYVWGDTKVTRQILVNGYCFNATNNLEAALRQLRSARKPRLLWVDAICIDQSNRTEKAEQVVQMDKVYRVAERVLIWLGRESRTSGFFFRWLREQMVEFKLNPFNDLPFAIDFPDIRGGAHVDCPRCSALPGGLIKIDPQEIITKSKIITGYLLSLLESANNILSRPWWTRSWVIQEVTLATNVSLCCGSDSIDWDCVRGGLYFIMARGRYTRRAVGDGPHGQSHLLASLTTRLFEILPLLVLSSSDKHIRSSDQLTLPKLLAFSSNFDATDPRDHIYSLLGLLPEDSEARKDFCPDYTRSVREVYIEFAKYFIQKTGNLDILGARLFMPQKSRQSQYSLPSWVPDWANKSPITNSISLGTFSTFHAMSLLGKDWTGNEQIVPLPSPEPMFSASLYEKSPYEFEFNGTEDDILTIRGVTIDRIEAQATYGIFDSLSAAPDGPPPLQSWQALCPGGLSGRYPFTNQTWREAFWRTVLVDRSSRCGNSISETRRLPEDISSQPCTSLFRHNYIQPSRFPPETSEEEDVMIAYLKREYVDRVTYNRFTAHSVGQQFFRTEKGYIGICDQSARVKDIVAVLFGSSVPLILRPRGEHYQFISESYVHGIMDGDIINSLRKMGREKPDDYEEFLII